MVPEEVFHYTKRDTAVEKIFFDKKIRFGQMGFTNDPKESKTRVFFDEDKSSKHDLLFEIIDKSKDIVTKEWKVFCFSQNHPDYKDNESPLFHSGACRPRMWASYGENHRGICLRFDGNKLDEQIKKELGAHHKIFHGPVVYDDTKALQYKRIRHSEIDKIGIQEGMRAYFLENWEEEFLLKSEDWKTEYEYRWLIHNTEDKPEYISIEGVITGVIIGMDFPNAYVPLIQKFCSELEIPAARIDWQNGNPYIRYYESRFLR